MKQEYHWLVELRAEPGGRPMPGLLYLFGESSQAIARAIIEADDERKIGVGKCWTLDAAAANYFSEEGAKKAAEALGRCCGGYCVAVEHGFIDETPNYGLPGEEDMNGNNVILSAAEKGECDALWARNKRTNGVYDCVDAAMRIGIARGAARAKEQAASLMDELKSATARCPACDADFQLAPPNEKWGTYRFQRNRRARRPFWKALA